MFSRHNRAFLRPRTWLHHHHPSRFGLPTANTKTRKTTRMRTVCVLSCIFSPDMPENFMLSLDKSHPKRSVSMRRGLSLLHRGGRTHPEVVRYGTVPTTLPFFSCQNAGDLMDEKITNNLSTKFAFRSSNPQEIRDILTLLGVKKMEGYETGIQNLRNRRCDADARRVNVVQWMLGTGTVRHVQHEP